MPYKINQTYQFKDWLNSVKDKKSKFRIIQRVKRMSDGNLGDVKMISNQVYEARLFFGPGFRLYYKILNHNEILLLLIGGDKSSQQKDIEIAIKLAEDYF